MSPLPFVHSHTVQCALYPLYYAQSLHDVELIHLEHLANYTFHNPTDHAPHVIVLHTRLSTRDRLCICVNLTSSIVPALGRSLRSLRFCTRLSNILLNAHEARRYYSLEVTGSPQCASYTTSGCATVVLPEGLCYKHVPATPIIRQDLVVVLHILGSIFLMGNTMKVGYSHTARSG